MSMTPFFLAVVKALNEVNGGNEWQKDFAPQDLGPAASDAIKALAVKPKPAGAVPLPEVRHRIIQWPMPKTLPRPEGEAMPAQYFDGYSREELIAYGDAREAAARADAGRADAVLQKERPDFVAGYDAGMADAKRMQQMTTQGEPHVVIESHWLQNIASAAALLEGSQSIMDRREAEALRKLIKSARRFGHRWPCQPLHQIKRHVDSGRDASRGNMASGINPARVALPMHQWALRGHHIKRSLIAGGSQIIKQARPRQ